MNSGEKVPGGETERKAASAKPWSASCRTPGAPDDRCCLGPPTGAWRIRGENDPSEDPKAAGAVQKMSVPKSAGSIPMVQRTPWHPLRMALGAKKTKRRSAAPCGSQRITTEVGNQRVSFWFTGWQGLGRRKKKTRQNGLASGPLEKGRNVAR